MTLTPEDATALLAAARAQDHDALRVRVLRAHSAIVPIVRATCLRSRALLEDAGEDVDDVVQEVLARLVETPPNHEGSADPVGTVLGWAKTVAMRYLLDRRRHRARLSREPLEGGDDDDDGPGVLARTGDMPDPDLGLEDRANWELLERCAEEELRGRAPRDYKAFRALAEDAELPALELARRLGLLSGEASEEEERKAVQLAWQVRSRLLERLSECLGRMRAEKIQAARSTRRERGRT